MPRHSQQDIGRGLGANKTFQGSRIAVIGIDADGPLKPARDAYAVNERH
jgi:hypothetical protein